MLEKEFKINGIVHTGCDACFEEHVSHMDLSIGQYYAYSDQLAQLGQSVCGTGNSFPCPYGFYKGR